MNTAKLKILVTGADGFIGKNLISHLLENHYFEILSYTRESNFSELEDSISRANLIVHLAGENRPAHEDLFEVLSTPLG